jgi:hypothetical protein
VATTTLKSGGISVDTTDFRAFAKALRKAAPVLSAEMRTELRAAGEIVAAEARQRASDVSKSVPPTIKVRVSGATVSVVAGGNGKPLAGLLELGNAGSGGGGKFRHPVFGNKKVWVSQDMHPFLFPALEARADEAQRGILNAVDKAVGIIVSEG